MLPDIELDECITMVSNWFEAAIRRYEETDDFEYVINAHQYKEILRHLEAYRELIRKEQE